MSHLPSSLLPSFLLFQAKPKVMKKKEARAIARQKEMERLSEQAAPAPPAGISASSPVATLQAGPAKKKPASPGVSVLAGTALKGFAADEDALWSRRSEGPPRFAKGNSKA